ncbi:MAG: deoxynucleoside kinase [Desulfobulbaceae bacterium]|nr:deoxynucleoside kinase [Desulfobulbaceae bacterium]
MNGNWVKETAEVEFGEMMVQLGLISIAGVIGVGKTTLAEKLARVFSAQLICEEYDKNPFLARQFAGEDNVALPSELFFLMSRACQLAPEAISPVETAVCDYIFEKNRIYARLSLDSRQFDVYDEVEKSVQPNITVPQTVIYLCDTVENCLERIDLRGRDFESVITAEWLSQLSGAYEELFENWSGCRLLRIDCSQCDLRQDETVKVIADRLLNETEEGTSSMISLSNKICQQIEI